MKNGGEADGTDGDTVEGGPKIYGTGESRESGPRSGRCNFVDLRGEAEYESGNDASPEREDHEADGEEPGAGPGRGELAQEARLLRDDVLDVRAVLASLAARAITELGGWLDSAAGP